MSVDSWKTMQNREGEMRTARRGANEMDIEAYNKDSVHRQTQFKDRLKVDHINDRLRESRELKEVWE